MLMMVDDVTEAEPLVHLQLASPEAQVTSSTHVLLVQVGWAQMQSVPAVVHLSAGSQTFVHGWVQVQPAVAVESHGTVKTPSAQASAGSHGLVHAHLPPVAVSSASHSSVSVARHVPGPHVFVHSQFPPVAMLSARHDSVLAGSQVSAGHSIAQVQSSSSSGLQSSAVAMVANRKHIPNKR